MQKLTDKQKWDLIRQSQEVLAEKQASPCADNAKQQIAEMGVAYLAETTAQLTSDSAVDFLKNFDAPTQKQILAELPSEKLNDIIEILSYPHGSTGSIMAKEFMAVPENLTVAEAIEKLYQLPVDRRGKAPYVYVINEKHELRGAIKTSDLIFNGKEKQLGEIMHSPVDCIEAEKPEIEAARLIRKQNHLALPVINREGRLTGVLSANNVAQILQEQADSDIAKMVGTSAEELQTPSVLGALKLRMPWLLFTILSGFLCAWISDVFQNNLQTLAVLFLFVPLVLGLSESIGIQGATIVVRNLSQGHIPFANLRSLFLKEGGAGFLIGLICAAIVGGIALVWKDNALLGLAIGGSMVVAIAISGLIGLLLPILFKAIKVDPAIASGPLVLALCDIQTLIVYFNLSGKILGN
ncbi:MAG TPA: magnesium transporter [Candidatus Omnitrophota bacterium]|nr:magnesium transporter [Candidatus Omnitrophota bacterium]